MRSRDPMTTSSARLAAWRRRRYASPAVRHRAAVRPLATPAVLAALLLGLLAGAPGTAPSPSARPAPAAAPAAYDFGQGLLEVSAKGGVYAFGADTYHGSASGESTIVGGARMTNNAGYWLASASGGVFSYGSAQFYGSMGGQYLPAPIVAMAATGDNGGYWLVGADGSVYAFGDAGYFGSEANQALAEPIVGMAPSGSSGYWLVGRDGGIFGFGSAHVAVNGSLPARTIDVDNIVGMAATRNGSGYWLVGSTGGVFAFTVPYYTSPPPTTLPLPIVGIQATTTGAGYWLVGSDGSIVAYGTAQYFGSETRTGVGVAGPVVGLAATPATGAPDSTPGSGYWITTSKGDVYGFSADVYGQRPGVTTVVSIASAATGKGYELAGANGGIYAYGTAPFYGSYLSFNDHISDLVGLARVVSSSGQADYCGAERNGWVHCFGSPEPTGGSNGCAGTYGALYGCAVEDSPPPIVAIVATADAKGYWEVSDTGRVYAFGDAQFRDDLETKGVHVTNVVGMAGEGPSGTTGYWMTGSTGGIYAFGFATFHGSFQNTGISANGSVVGIAAPDANNGYWLATTTGGVFALRKNTFPFYGSMGGKSLPASVTAIAAVA